MCADDFFETEYMNKKQMESFVSDFKREIGTEIEINEPTPGVLYAVCCDLTPDELHNCVNYESDALDIEE